MKDRKWTTSQKLQFAAFAVAATRFMAMGAMALGTDLVAEYDFVFWLEVISWLGFAALEGYAVPYLAKGTRKLPKDAFEYKQLVTYRYVILAAIPLLGAPYYVAMSSSQSILDVLGPIYWVWAFLLCGVSALIIDAVGTVEEMNEEMSTTLALKPELAVLDKMLSIGTIRPDILSEETGLPLSKVDETLSKVQDLMEFEGIK